MSESTPEPAATPASAAPSGEAASPLADPLLPPIFVMGTEYVEKSHQLGDDSVTR